MLRGLGVVSKQRMGPVAHSTVSAISDIEFELRDGDRLAVLGANGSGKTTLLQLIAGIFAPSCGRIEASTEIFPLLNVGFGMDPEATGYENIFLMGYLRNRSRTESALLVDEVRSVSGLGGALERPVYSYSSGMKTRLAVSIAVCNQPEIVVVDEFIGTGDADFRQKSTDLMREMFMQSGVLIFASHSLPMIRQLCNKALYLDRGRMVAFGDVEEVIGLKLANK